MAISMSGVIDPRTPLQKLRRLHLREILLSEGKTVSPDATADRMRRMIEDEGVRVDQYFTRSVHGQIVPNEPELIRLTRERRRQMRADRGVVPDDFSEAPKVEAPATTEPSPLQEVGNLKMPDLRKLCKKLGIKGVPQDKKEDLIRKIQEHGNAS